MKRLLILLYVMLLVAIVTNAHALQFVSSRPAMSGDDYVDWGVLGPQNTLIPKPFTISSAVYGVQLTVDKPGGINFLRLDAGAGWPTTGWDYPSLLFPNLQGPIEITFATPVRGVGAQAQGSLPTYKMLLDVYGEDGSLLGSFNVTEGAFNPPIFLGVLDDNLIIKKVVFQCVDPATGNPAANGFVINRLELVTQPVPEPSTLTALGIGGLLFGLANRRRKV